jgi:hypothetical protein
MAAAIVVVGVPHARTKEMLETQLTGRSDDCCFSDTILGTNKVSDFGQWYLNQAIDNNHVPGGCGKLTTGCEYLGRTLFCCQLHQPPALQTDAPKERCKRAVSCFFSTCCFPVGLALLYRADSQASRLVAPVRVEMT